MFRRPGHHPAGPHPAADLLGAFLPGDAGQKNDQGVKPSGFTAPASVLSIGNSFPARAYGRPCHIRRGLWWHNRGGVIWWKHPGFVGPTCPDRRAPRGILFAKSMWVSESSQRCPHQVRPKLWAIRGNGLFFVRYLSTAIFLIHMRWILWNREFQIPFLN